MKAFLLAALPWVLCGIAVAIICARLGTKKEEPNKKLEQRIALGMALGLMLSPALNSFGLWESHAIGFALCPLWGMALACLFQSKDVSGE